MNKRAETMTAAQARAYLSRSEENRVKDKDGDKWALANEGFRCNEWLESAVDFDDYAPFTIHRTERQLRERVKELEAALADQSEALTAAHMAGYVQGQENMAQTCRESNAKHILRAEAAEARVKALEHDAYAVGYNAGIAKMEDKLATVTAERDALVAKLQAPIRRPDDYMFES